MNEQPTLGDLLRDQGIAQVLSHNESYADRFYSAAGILLERHGEITSTAVVELVGMPDGSPNAIGAAMRSFAKRRGLHIDRYVKSSRPSCHSAVVAVWKRKL